MIKNNGNVQSCAKEWALGSVNSPAARIDQDAGSRNLGLVVSNNSVQRASRRLRDPASGREGEFPQPRESLFEGLSIMC